MHSCNTTLSLPFLWLCVCVWPVYDAEDGVQQSKQDELSVQQLVDAPLPAQQQLVKTEEGGVGDFTGISNRHPETEEQTKTFIQWELVDNPTGFLVTAWIINTTLTLWT